MESEIWSAILSGCPSVTDSEVNVHLLMSSPCLGAVVRPERRPRHRAPRGRPRACRSAAHDVASPSGHRIKTSLVSCSKPDPGRGHVVGDEQVDAPCGRASPRRARTTSSVSAAKPTSVWPGALRAPSSARMSTVGRSSTTGTPSRFLSLSSATCDRGEVGDRGRHDDHVRRSAPRRVDRSCICAAVATSTRSTPADDRQRRRGHQGDRRPRGRPPPRRGRGPACPRSGCR